MNWGKEAPHVSRWLPWHHSGHGAALPRGPAPDSNLRLHVTRVLLSSTGTSAWLCLSSLLGFLLRKAANSPPALAGWVLWSLQPYSDGRLACWTLSCPLCPLSSLLPSDRQDSRTILSTLLAKKLSWVKLLQVSSCKWEVTPAPSLELLAF